MDRQEEFVLRTIEERDIRFVRLWFTDVLGTLKSVAVAPAELEGAFTEGIGFDGSAIEGFARVYEADMLAKPDPSTFQVLPWRGDSPGTARMFCDLLLPDGSPSFADPRQVLQRALAQGGDLGFTFYTHPEIEFYLLKRRPQAGQGPGPGRQRRLLRPRPAWDRPTTSGAPRSPCSRRWASRWSSAITRAGPGQNEIDLRYADALSTADNIMTFRTVVKEVALEQGIYATSCPSRSPTTPAPGCTPTCRSSRATRNAFYEAGAPYQLSKVGRQFIAGLLRHGAEITAVTNQWVNSYKRLWGGGEAPAT